MADPEKLKKGAIVSAAYDTLLQVGLRLMSFVLNAFIVRHVSREVFAVMTVRLHLLYATGLLLSREAFRRASLSSKDNRQIYKVINLIWIGSVVCVPVCFLGCYIWLYVMERPPDSVTTNYLAGVIFMSVSVFVEVSAEVPFVLAELQLWSKTKVVIEGLMQLLRSVLLAAAVYMWPVQAVFMYGVSHLIGSVIYWVSYYGLFIHHFSRLKKDDSSELLVHQPRQLFPKWTSGKVFPEVDKELGQLSWSFFKQGWLKEALTEGEFYLMNFFPLISLAQQGVYQVVSNLGSLAARLVFRSIEAASYKYFAQMLYRGKEIQEQDQDRVAEVTRFLASLLRNLLLISAIILSFGWSYSHALLQLYGGSQLSDGGGTPLMRAQCVFVIFLAINGVTEAYTFAAMDDDQLSRYNSMLILFSVMYIGTAVFLTQIFGALGFVLGNCINMGLRITYSFWFIHKQYHEREHHPLGALWLSTWLLLVFASSWVVTAVSEIIIYPRSMVGHIAVGAISLLLVLFFLRWELQAVYEKILLFISRIISRNSHEDLQLKDRFNHVWQVDMIHRLLYGSRPFKMD